MYTVQTGYYGRNENKFTDFAEALDFYKKNPDAQLFGEYADFDCDEDGYVMVSDGLTEEERDAIAQAGIQS